MGTIFRSGPHSWGMFLEWTDSGGGTNIMIGTKNGGELNTDKQEKMHILLKVPHALAPTHCLINHSNKPLGGCYSSSGNLVNYSRGKRFHEAFGRPTNIRLFVRTLL